VMVNVQFKVTYIKLIDNKPVEENKDISVTMFYDVMTTPPSVGDKVTVSLEGNVDLPDDEM